MGARDPLDIVPQAILLWMFMCTYWCSYTGELFVGVKVCVWMDFYVGYDHFNCASVCDFLLPKQTLTWQAVTLMRTLSAHGLRVSATTSTGLSTVGQHTPRALDPFLTRAVQVSTAWPDTFFLKKCWPLICKRLLHIMPGWPVLPGIIRSLQDSWI